MRTTPSSMSHSPAIRITGVLGPQFRRVTLKDENRWGLLGKGAVELRTSYGDRTSPVLRGEYVLDRILGTPPTPPPPGVNTDLSVHEGQPPATVRARLEAHRANPTCKGCHGVMDPFGLAMENFDVTGRWRTVDAQAKNAPIDATTELTSGALLNGPPDLRRYLTRRPEQFPTTVTKRLMMYALNRELEYYDMPPDPQDRGGCRAGQLHAWGAHHRNREQRFLPPPGSRYSVEGASAHKSGRHRTPQGVDSRWQRF